MDFNYLPSELFLTLSPRSPSEAVWSEGVQTPGALAASVPLRVSKAAGPST